ncbi:MAG: MinD/ParA family protein [Sulfurihydrogenibium sp.]|jgi:flagellar biosynthesis protein FlhG|nr:MinD/ParA family protein [Sulfurihydrogenibium sp.]
MMEQQLKQLKELVNKVNPQALQTKRNPKFLCVSSGKGGAGKTNFSINLAYIMANHFNKKVLLIDADIGLGNVHIILNIPLIKSLKEFFEGKDIKENIIKVKNFDLIPGFSGIDSISDMENVNLNYLIKRLEEISGEYDYIIIDTAAGIGKEVISFILPSDKTYIITTPEPTALTDAYSLIKSVFKIYGYSNFKVVINMCKSEEEGIETFERLSNSCKRFLNLELNLAGILPFSENLKKSVVSRTLISESYETDSFTKKLLEIAEKEMGENIKRENIESFFKRLFSFIK